MVSLPQITSLSLCLYCECQTLANVLLALPCLQSLTLSDPRNRLPLTATVKLLARSNQFPPIKRLHLNKVSVGGTLAGAVFFENLECLQLDLDCKPCIISASHLLEKWCDKQQLIKLPWLRQIHIRIDKKVDEQDAGCLNTVGARFFFCRPRCQFIVESEDQTWKRIY
jgi:hypothetical protein